MRTRLPELVAFADGSGTHVTGEPACVGVCVVKPAPFGSGFPLADILMESSACIGLGTNNVAELWAIRRALHSLRAIGGYRLFTGQMDAVLYSDSLYAICMTGGSYKNRPGTGNYDLVEACKDAYHRTPNVELRHVRGHSNIDGNTLADWLAGIARARAMNRQQAKRRVPMNLLALHCDEDVWGISW